MCVGLAITNCLVQVGQSIKPWRMRLFADAIAGLNEAADEDNRVSCMQSIEIGDYCLNYA